MAKLKPKLIIAGSSKKKGGFGGGIGYFITLILVFAVGVYVGMKFDDTGLSRDKLNEISQHNSADGKDSANKGSEIKENVSRDSDSDSKIHTISSDSGGIITEGDIIDTETGASSGESLIQKNQNLGDTQEPADVDTSESSGDDVAVNIETSDIAGSESSGIDLAEADIYRLQVAAFKNTYDADEAVSKLRNRGYDAYIVQSTNSRGEDWNLIKVGKFETAQEAWNFSTVYQSQEGGEVFVESLKRGRVNNESLEENDSKE